MKGGGPTGRDVGCRVHDSGAQSIPTATATIVDFNSERYDTDSMHDGGGGEP